VGFFNLNSSDAANNGLPPTRKRQLNSEGDKKTPNKCTKQNGKGDGGYRTECVFLSGINEDLRKNSIKLKQELLKAVPNVKVKDPKLTHSGCVMLTPLNPEDVNRLLKEDWSKHSFLGDNIRSSLPNHKKLEYKAVILGIDPEITEDDIREELKSSNGITVTAVTRLVRRECKTRTFRVMVTLENEEIQREVL
jgi:hypothetical protein